MRGVHRVAVGAFAAAVMTVAGWSAPPPGAAVGAAAPGVAGQGGAARPFPVTAPSTTASGATGTSTAAPARWTLAARVTESTAHAGQGLAVVTGRSGVAQVVTRGNADIPPALVRAGWVHVGDPGSSGGWLVDAYQGRTGSRAKMFLLTGPDGRQVTLVHPLVGGERYNNSFAAVSPDGRWIVSAEWQTITRLLVFPLPGPIGVTPRAPLPLAGTITLTKPMRDVQGCSFTSSTSLICTTNDPQTTPWPVARQVLQVSLDRPLGRTPVIGTPAVLFPVPQHSACPGHGETEGVDVTAGVLRLVVIEPGHCRAVTDLYTYVAAAV